MNVISNDIPLGNRSSAAVPHLALIRERDRALSEALSAQIRALGILNIELCPPDGGETILRKMLRHPQRAGVMVAGIRDAIVGPVEVADLRRDLPGWVIIVMDHIDTAHSSADALAAGADDVLRVPYPAMEFEARLALRMRQAGMAETSMALKTPLFARAQLTPVETAIMRILMAQKGQIVTRNHLSQRLDQSDWLYGDRKFDVHITRIRKKLKAAFGERYEVRTIRSKGYLLQSMEDGRMS
jgi:hypothetical protein